MRNKALLLITMLIASGSALAEQDMLGIAGKTLLKDTATSAAPKGAVEGVEAAGQKLETANTLKSSVKSAPDALKGQAQDMAMESAKQKLGAAVPENAKQGIKTLETGSTAAKTLQGGIPLSTDDATKAIKGKVQEEATNKALDMMK